RFTDRRLLDASPTRRSSDLGVAAAVTTARLGGSVVLIEPSQRLGGLTTGGLGQTDIGNKRAIGGISREFYERVRRHYDNPSAWKDRKSTRLNSSHVKISYAV